MNDLGRPIELLLELFRSVPHVMVCVKNDDGVYVGVNRAFVRRTRRRHASDVLGRRAHDLFPADLAASYDAQDRALLATGQAVRNQLEPIADADHPGDGRWYLTTKVRHDRPDRPDRTGRADRGPMVVVTSVDAQLGDRADAATGLRAAIELVHDRWDRPLLVDDLARAAGMSTDRLERAMQRALAISPKQYILRIRAERAAALLATTRLPIARIAADCGYYDQSQMTRQFRVHIGVTPSSYRHAVSGGQ
ncbi:MAG: AraC family transcriptional regulator [Ilumatobacteraceae bacterium]|nr:AraC family transcriptional regulator [Ilumatobacteraceae bacterium]